MSFFESLRAEIAAFVGEQDHLGNEIVPDWIAHAVCNNHNTGLADDESADFWRQSGYRTVRAATGEYLRRWYDPQAAIEELRAGQLTLPGFDHVQRHYIVERDGDNKAIPVGSMTDEEIEGKIAHMISVSSTLLAHADELRRYLLGRHQSSLAG
jgi:hypothetical protein